MAISWQTLEAISWRQSTATIPVRWLAFSVAEAMWVCRRAAQGSRVLSLLIARS
jgi:hypothetical protein